MSAMNDDDDDEAFSAIVEGMIEWRTQVVEGNSSIHILLFAE